MQNFEERLRTCVRQEGRHLSNVIIRNWVINVSNQNCIYYGLFWCWHNFFILKINKVTIIWKTCVLFAPPVIYQQYRAQQEPILSSRDTVDNSPENMMLLRPFQQYSSDNLKSCNQKIYPCTENKIKRELTRLWAYRATVTRVCPCRTTLSTCAYWIIIRHTFNCTLTGTVLQTTTRQSEV